MTDPRDDDLDPTSLPDADDAPEVEPDEGPASHDDADNPDVEPAE